MVPVMTSLVESSRSLRRAFPVVALAAALGLSGCGSGTDDTSAEPTVDPGLEDSNNPDSDEPSDSEEPAAADAPEPVAVLPFEIEVPSGYRMLPARCEPGYPNDPERPRGESSDSSDDEADYSTWITYAVPETWESVGRGSAGSGSVTGSDEDLSFRVDRGDGSTGDVNIEIVWDNRDFDGNITDYNGDPWESFDYDNQVGDDNTTITYENVATLGVGDQEAELFYRDPAQAPDDLSVAQYRVRLDAFELPKNNTSGGYELVPQSFVVTFEFDNEKIPLDQATIESIVESFVLPECSWDGTLLDHELLLNLDLNGDGHIRDADDVQKELAEMQEGLEEQMEEQRKESSDE